MDRFYVACWVSQLSASDWLKNETMILVVLYCELYKLSFSSAIEILSLFHAIEIKFSYKDLINKSLYKGDNITLEYINIKLLGSSKNLMTNSYAIYADSVWYFSIIYVGKP